MPGHPEKTGIQLTNPTRIKSQPQQNSGKHARQNIIDHDTQTAVHLLIQPFNRLWRENIEKPEQDKTRYQGLPAKRNQPNRYQEVGNFILNDAAKIMFTRLF